MERFAVKKSLDLGIDIWTVMRGQQRLPSIKLTKVTSPPPGSNFLLLMNSHFKSIEMLRFKFFISSSYHVSPAEKKFEIWQFFVYYDAQDGV